MYPDVLLCIYYLCCKKIFEYTVPIPQMPKLLKIIAIFSKKLPDVKKKVQNSVLKALFDADRNRTSRTI